MMDILDLMVAEFQRPGFTAIIRSGEDIVFGRWLVVLPNNDSISWSMLIVIEY